MAQDKTEMSQDTKTIITVVLLVTVYPVGVILMWVWTKWPVWLKIILTLPVFLMFLLIPLAITLMAINPEEQFSQANNAKRISDISAIAGAVSNYENEMGMLPEGITTEAQEISTNGADICKDIVSSYIAALPSDPLIPNNPNIVDCSSSYAIGYTISADADGNVTVAAPQAELDETITITQ